jgi:23S rRNA (uridine2552-2'-O)-methyltransferase
MGNGITRDGPNLEIPMIQKFQTLKKAKRLKKSSQKWLLRQINDPFVERARLEKLRSRAAFKIMEIDEKFKIFKKGKIIVDLGATPGGWSQYAVTKVGAGNVIAVDLLEMSPIPGVKFLQSDFLASNIWEEIISLLKSNPYNKRAKCDAVLSDMAANTSGDSKTDHIRIIELLEEALNLAEKILAQKGCFIGKIFQGGSSVEIMQKLQKNFTSVKYFKPNSSRKDSPETYLIALGFHSD